jgi:putative transposase
MTAATEVMPKTGITPILVALGLSVATFYRRKKAAPAPSPRPTPARALSPAERTAVLDELHSERFIDRAPAEVFHTLLDENRYLCSERTMYRILADHDEVRERRDQLRHPAYTKPELVATAPNQVWSWDITKLKTFEKLVYLYLYVILDIFSRYVVGWLLAERESTELAKRLVEETGRKQQVLPGQVTLHADRGGPMISDGMVQLLAKLDIVKSHSRPHVSDDNPFSESQFKTLKYHPGFPERFGGLDEGLAHCRQFFPWYNDEHRHSGICYLTPGDVHHGRADEVLRRRYDAKQVAFQAHPERFLRSPALIQLPKAVYINPPSRPAPQLEAGGKPANQLAAPPEVVGGTSGVPSLARFSTQQGFGN